MTNGLQGVEIACASGQARQIRNSGVTGKPIGFRVVTARETTKPPTDPADNPRMPSFLACQCRYSAWILASGDRERALRMLRNALEPMTKRAWMHRGFYEMR